MRRTLDPARLGETAIDDAEAAAVRAGVEVVLLEDLEALRGTSGLFAEIWGTGGGDAQIHPDLLRAMVHAGNYAAGAYSKGSHGGSDGELVGAIVAFLGTDEDGPYLHSHILGVSKEHRGSNVGFALKLHQRAWALEHGLSKVTWTFDPLVRRNAFFNLQKLGADAAAYLEQFYGSMSDGINAGDESDRLLIVWDLHSPRVADASSGRLDEPHHDDLAASGASVVLTANGDAPRAKPIAGATVLCATPENIVAIRRQQPDVALQWRHALRDTLGAAMRDGFVVTGFTRSGWYVLSRAEG
jgi:predicted GNAT superfamily acetyltransferase